MPEKMSRRKRCVLVALENQVPRSIEYVSACVGGAWPWADDPAPAVLERLFSQLEGRGLVGHVDEPTGRYFYLTPRGREEAAREDLRLTCEKCGRCLRVRSADAGRYDIHPDGRTTRRLPCPYCSAGFLGNKYGLRRAPDAEPAGQEKGGAHAAG